MRNDPHALRQLINGPALLAQYSQLTSYLILGYKPIFQAPTGPVAEVKATEHRVIGWEPLTPGDISRLDKALVSISRMLNKVLPELRAVDISDSSTQQLVSPQERANRIYAAIDGLRRNPETRDVFQALSSSLGMNARAH